MSGFLRRLAVLERLRKRKRGRRVVVVRQDRPGGEERRAAAQLEADAAGEELTVIRVIRQARDDTPG